MNFLGESGNSFPTLFPKVAVMFQLCSLKIQQQAIELLECTALVIPTDCNTDSCLRAQGQECGLSMTLPNADVFSVLDDLRL